MANVWLDKYVLGQSQNGSVASVGQEITLNLQLQPSTNTSTGGNVTGTVKDSSGNPIVNALVKIMDANYTPLMHDITDTSGTYNFTNLSSNQTYNIFATASGMTLNQGNQFTVSNYQDRTINFTLTPDSAMSLGVIAGDLIDQSTNLPINGAVVSLYLINTDGSETIQAITYTNQYGQYTFRQVPQGNYSVEITALGYNTTSTNVTINQTGQLIPMNVTMVQNPNTSRGTVSGIITNNNNQPINRADVILYKVNADNSLTPVAFTKTTSSGIYLFANVDPGTYKVKSNEIEIVNITVSVYYSPSFSYFSVSNYTTLSVNSTTGTLAGGAQLQTANQVVGFIGGATNGSTTISVSAPTTGNYIMGVQYINGDSTPRGLLVDVNGVNTGTSYSCPSSSGWTINNMLIVSIPVTLTQGANLVKLYNVTSYGPSIGMVYFAPIISQDPTTGVYANGAQTSLGYAGYIGGPSGGTVTLTFTATVAGNYTMSLPCRNLSRGLAIDVNSVNIYNNTNSIGTSPLVITIPLQQGSNTILFHGTTTAFTVDVGPFTLSPVFQINYYNATTATLAGSATVSNGFVTGIQSKNGSITFNATVPAAGQYNFGMAYVALDNNKQCNIDVNSVSANQTYGFTNTTNLTAANITYKFIPLTFTTGANTIKVYNQ